MRPDFSLLKETGYKVIITAPGLMVLILFQDFLRRLLA
jgi:hypothetical protein